VLGSSRRATSKRKRSRAKQRPEVSKCFEALNNVHQLAPAPSPDVAEALKVIRTRLVQLEQTHNAKAGVLAQIERWAARCSAAFAFFLIHPLLAYWEAAGYPYPGASFWAAESVVASLSTALGWFGATMIVARVVVGAVLGWLFIVLCGCLLAAWLFSKGI
jgi:hypothetical protein